MNIAALRRHWQRLRSNTLLMNALYLMLSTFVVAATGFVFWVVVAHTYNTPAVGVATALLSVSNLLALLGLAGFDTTLVRFLPKATDKNAHINSGFIVVTALSGILALGAAMLLPHWSSSLSELHQPAAVAAFVFFTVATTLNTLTNSVFLAFRQARNIFIINTLFSFFKVLLPLTIRGSSALTIFVLAGSAQLVGLLLSIGWLQRTCGYVYAFTVDRQVLREVKRFSLSMYAASVLNLLPPTLLPLLVVHYRGPKDAAYYYMAFTIAGVLYTVAYSAMQSVFAESSHNEAALRAHVGKAARMIAILLVPAALLTAALAKPLLHIFGAAYAQNGSTLLQLFALSAVVIAAYSALGAIFKVTKNLRGIVAMNITYAGVIIAMSAWRLPTFGLPSVGWAWAVGNLAACGIGALFLLHHNKLKGVSHGGTTSRARQ